MKSWQKKYPPYVGEEPYAYFAFADADSRKVKKVIGIMAKRGFRLWYSTGKAGSAEELMLRQEKAANAEVTFLYLSDAAVSDKSIKSLILANQSNEKTIVCLDSDGRDRRLAMGLRESVQLIPLYSLSGKMLDDALIKADGVSQQIIGESVIIYSPWKAVIVLLILSALIAAGGYYYAACLKPEPDTVFFNDGILTVAARDAVGGGALTEENIGEITELSLPDIPESWDELEKFISLEKIILPQDKICGFTGELPEKYTVAISGGEE